MYFFIRLLAMTVVNYHFSLLYIVYVMKIKIFIFLVSLLHYTDQEK